MARTKAHASTNKDTVVIGAHSGHAIVAKNSPLARLNYFDGKFLRASDLSLEQQAMLAQVQLAARAGGAGLVHGLDCSLQGTDTIRVTPGTGLDWTGRPLVLSEQVELGIGGLIDASAGLAPPRDLAKSGSAGFGPCTLKDAGNEVDVTAGTVFYLVTAHAVEAYCGSEDVYGKLCSEACVSSSEASHIVPGLRLLARPITLDLQPLQIATGKCQLRSRASSAYFHAERQAIPALIGAEGVLNPLWCLGAAAAGGDGIPLALLARQGTETLFVDSWAVRRERFEMPPAQYWAWRMAMRPRPVYWAQVAQFQCMLECCLGDGVPTSPTGGCDPEMTRESAESLRALTEFYAAATRAMPTAVGPTGLVADLPEIAELERQIARLEAAGATTPSDRILVDCGIVELPSAGYLPVAPSDTFSVNRQVRALLGPGVDLRFCAVRPDFVPHALEEAQHMDRISLLDGLDDPDQRPEVDILVPNGEILKTQAAQSGIGHRSSIGISERLLRLGQPPKNTGPVEQPALSHDLNMARRPVVSGERPISTSIATEIDLTTSGAARTLSEAAGPTFYAAGFAEGPLSGARASAAVGQLSEQFGFWLECEMSGDPGTAAIGATMMISARLTGAGARDSSSQFIIRRIQGEITVIGATSIAGGREVTGKLVAELTSRRVDASGSDTSGSLPLTGTIRLTINTGTNGHREERLVLSDTSLFANLPGVELELTRSWTGTGRQRIELLERLPSDVRITERALMRIDLERDDGVLSPGHSAHSDALRAINLIATSTNQQAEAERAEAKLFPPQKAPSQTLDLRASLPWVLFHRRRTKQCAPEPEETKPLPQRNYRLFNVQIDDDFSPGTIKEIISGGGLSDLLEKFPPRPDGSVAFVEGRSSLATEPLDLQSDWSTVLPNRSEAIFGVIASQGDVLEEGDTIAKTRLSTVTTTLSSVMPAVQNYDVAVLDQVPSAASVGSLDGAILYFTFPSQTLCHTVYRMTTGSAEEVGMQLREYFADPKDDLGPFLTQLGATTLVSQPRFDGDNSALRTEVDAAQLASAWDLVGGGTAAAGYSISARRAEETTAEVAAQSTTIAKTTGSPLVLSTKDHRTLSTSRLGGCPRATVLLVSTDCTTVAFHVATDSLDRRMAGLTNLIERRGIPQTMFQSVDNGEPQLRTVTDLTFLGLGTRAPLSEQALSTQWSEQVSGLPEILGSGIIAIAREESEIPRARADAEAVSRAIGIEGSSIQEVVIPPGTAFPVTCRTLTIPVLIVRQG